MKTILFTIICIIALLWVGDLTITFKPFSISLIGMLKKIGFLLCVAEIYYITKIYLGYKYKIIN